MSKDKSNAASELNQRACSLLNRVGGWRARDEIFPLIREANESFRSANEALERMADQPMGQRDYAHVLQMIEYGVDEAKSLEIAIRKYSENAAVCHEANNQKGNSI